jgi:O6-methylguanine-DNA--protein-cysteine methyltransferase
MTLGPNKEPIMTAITEELDESLDADGFRYELARRIERFIAKKLQLWTTCENTVCRRAKQCAGQDCECVEKWHASLPPLSEEEGRAHLIDFQKALSVRISLGETATSEQIAEAIDKERAERRAATRLWDSDKPAPGSEGTKLAPEQDERIGRVEPGPRITQL